MAGIIRRPNPFSFPGIAPGFDPDHLAAKGISGTHGLSAVATGSGFSNLVTGKPGTTTFGGGTSFLTNRNGPAFNWPTSATGQNVTFPGTSIADTVGTVAVIGTFISTAGGMYVCSDLNNHGGFRLDGSGMTMPFVAGVNHFLTLPTNVPFFYAASKTPAVVNFIIVNLATGSIQTAAVANSNTPVAPQNPISVIGDAGGQGTPVGSVSAAMWAPVALSMPHLLQWAKDPWAFWYPNKIDVLTSLSSPGSGPTPSGTLVATEARDVAVISGTAGGATGSLSTTEAIDTALINGGAGVVGTLVATEARDVAVISGGAGVVGTLSATEAPDTALISGTSGIAGQLAATESADTALINATFASVANDLLLTGTTGYVLLAAPDVPGSGCFILLVDGLSRLLEVNGTDRLLQTNCTPVGGGTPTGTLAAIETADTANIVGSISALPSGILAATEARDVCVISGTVVAFAIGPLAATEPPDLAQFFGTFTPPTRQVSKVPYPSIWDYGWYNRRPPLRR